MAALDPTIHQPIRLSIMAALMALEAREQMDFTSLRELVQATDGNLGAHLQKLEDAGYIAVEKTFVGRKPRTFVAVTVKGRHAFQQHVVALREIIGG